jgi:hypothetical protein
VEHEFKQLMLIRPRNLRKRNRGICKLHKTAPKDAASGHLDLFLQDKELLALLAIHSNKLLFVPFSGQYFQLI